MLTGCTVRRRSASRHVTTDPGCVHVATFELRLCYTFISAPLYSQHTCKVITTYRLARSTPWQTPEAHYTLAHDFAAGLQYALASARPAGAREQEGESGEGLHRIEGGCGGYGGGTSWCVGGVIYHVYCVCARGVLQDHSLAQLFPRGVLLVPCCAAGALPCGVL